MHSELCLEKKKRKKERGGGGWGEVSNQTMKRLPRHGAAKLARPCSRNKDRLCAVQRLDASVAPGPCRERKDFFFLSCLSLHLQEQRLHPCLNRGRVDQQQ